MTDLFITNTEPKYQLNILIKTDDEITSEFLFNYYSKYESKNMGDSGIDLVSPTDLEISSKSINTLDFNIQCSMVNLKNNEYVSYYLYPRSSISNTPLRLANSVGIIDAGYRGNIMAKMDSLNEYSIKKGDRLFQICAPNLKFVKVVLVIKLNKTDRGEKGFGSSGK